MCHPSIPTRRGFQGNVDKPLQSQGTCSVAQKVASYHPGPGAIPSLDLCRVGCMFDFVHRPQACCCPGAGSQRVSAIPSANDTSLLKVFRELGWGCVRVAWCQHYSRLPALKPDFINHETFFSTVDYFHVEAKFKRVTIHFKRSTKVFKLCVCPVQNDRVVQRGGFHASDGHMIQFVFANGYVNQWRNKCFDEECVASLSDKLGTARGDIPQPLQMKAFAAFRLM